MKNTYLLALVAIVVVVGAGWYLFGGSNSPQTLPVDDQQQVQQEELAAVVEVGDERYPIAVAQGTTALGAMEVAQRETAFDFAGTAYEGLGFFVQEVNGTASTTDHFWIYYINGEEAQVGVSDYIVQEGDVITWLYEEAE
jgi:hypothetical protein